VEFVCLDLEGVLIPEIWIQVAKKTGIEGLRATTRDIPDYNELMRQRLKLMDGNGLVLADIQAVIDDMGPLEGAEAFLNGLREVTQGVILSDTFYEFARPLMRQLGWPTLFCHRLETASDGSITGYRLRMDDHKRQTVRALHGLNFNVAAVGDSYNDTGMLTEADAGYLFLAPAKVVNEFPQFPVFDTYSELLSVVTRGLKDN